MRSAVTSRSHGAQHVNHEAPACAAGVQRLGCNECHPAAAERVDQRGKIGDAAGAAVQLGNQHGADLAAVSGRLCRFVGLWITWEHEYPAAQTADLRPLEGDLCHHQQRFQSSAAYSPTRAQRTRGGKRAISP